MPQGFLQNRKRHLTKVMYRFRWRRQGALPHCLILAERPLALFDPAALPPATGVFGSPTVIAEAAHNTTHYLPPTDANVP